MARLKYSKSVARGKKARRPPSEIEDLALFFVGQGVVTIGELIKDLASHGNLSSLSAERIITKAIKDGILDVMRDIFED